MVQKFQDVTIASEDETTIIKAKTYDRSLLYFQVFALLIPALLISLTGWYIFTLPVLVLTLFWMYVNIKGKYIITINTSRLLIRKLPLNSKILDVALSEVKRIGLRRRHGRTTQAPMRPSPSTTGPSVTDLLLETPDGIRTLLPGLSSAEREYIYRLLKRKLDSYYKKI